MNESDPPKKSSWKTPTVEEFDITSATQGLKLVDAGETTTSGPS